MTTKLPDPLDPFAPSARRVRPPEADMPGGPDTMVPRWMAVTFFCVALLFWVMLSMYWHIRAYEAKLDGVRHGEGVTTAELFEHLSEARRRVPEYAFDVSYRSQWRHTPTGRKGRTSVRYEAPRKEFDRERAATRSLTKIEGPKKFKHVGATVSRGWYFLKDYPGHVDLELYDDERLTVWKFWHRGGKGAPRKLDLRPAPPPADSDTGRTD